MKEREQGELLQKVVGVMNAFSSLDVEFQPNEHDRHLAMLQGKQGEVKQVESTNLHRRCNQVALWNSP